MKPLTSSKAMELYKKLYSLRLDRLVKMSKKEESTLDEVLSEIQEHFCTRGCINGDLTDGGLFTPVNWCDCPLGVEASKDTLTIGFKIDGLNEKGNTND